jgi:hypothetical protein
MTEHFEASSKILGTEHSSPRKGRGRAKRSLTLIDAMFDIAKAMQPITGRGIGYKLFVRNLIDSMSRHDMNGVYRLLKEAREEGIIPWEWIVDETRELEKVAAWNNPTSFVRTMGNSYRREFWQRQPIRIEVWSEKGTVRGLLRPTLDQYGVGFRPVHGFSGATAVHDVADDNDRRPLIIIYVGDYDPSGMCMSEIDLPKRFEKYGGDHVSIKRIAIVQDDCTPELPSFSASDKSKDPRYKWFTSNFGTRCWELDAMDPPVLRSRVEEAIKEHIEWQQWNRDVLINEAEQKSLRTVLDGWGKKPTTWWEEKGWNFRAVAD